MHKIAQVAFSGPSGAADLCAALSIAGQRAGVPQALAFWGTETSPPDRIARCESAGITVAKLPKARGFDAAGQRAIKQWVAQNKNADAMILHYPAALLPVWRSLRGARRPKIVMMEHHPNTLKRLHEWLLSALAFILGDGVVYNTESYRTQVQRRLGPLFRSQRTTIINNGLDLDRYRRPAVATNAGRDTYTIGMSGRMMPVKDYRTLLLAFARLSKNNSQLQTRLELAGDGPMRQELETLVSELGIARQVTFLGLLPQDDLIRRMWQWDVFCLSTFGETQSLALMEAMACGLPCLSTNVSGVKEVITHGQNGLLIEPEDVEAMTKSLSNLVNLDLRTALGQTALMTAESRFSATAMWNNYRKYLEIL